nr:VCBS repeat-containing protein [Nannocystis sp. SCPEA4]
MEPERHPTGAVPRALIAADLDAEGPPELITADDETGTVTVLHQFVAAPPVVVGPGPRALAAGDLDSDGHVDVAVALADADAVQVLRGDGHGGLSPAALHPVGTAPYDLVAADLDLDGHLDLATADSLDDTVSVLFGDGAGGLRARTTWPTVPLPSSLVVSQPPGEPPVLGVLSPTTSTVEHLDPRTGQAFTGVLASEPQSVTDDGGILVTAGKALSYMSLGTGIQLTPLWQEEGDFLYEWFVDLDGDGIDELLTWDFDTEAEAVTLREDGASVTIPVGIDQPGSIEAADLTGDGRPDLLVIDYDKFVVSIQQPDGTFVPGPVVISEGYQLLADIDADGVAEVLVVEAVANEGRIDVFRGDETGQLTLAESASFALAGPPDYARVVDGDGDDLPDLLVSAKDKMVYLEDAQGPARYLALAGGFYSIAFGDLDSDGRLDAVICQGTPYIFNDILGPSTVRLLADDAPGCSAVDAFDLDGDGDLEIVSGIFADDSSRFTPWLLQDGEWEPQGSQTIPYNGNYGAGFAQLDGVGPPDFWVDDLNSIHTMRLELGPALLEHEHLRLADRERLRFADIDADGAADLLMFGNDIAVARADGSGSFGPLSVIRPEGPRRIDNGVLADLAGNGAPLFAWSEFQVGISVADVAFDGLRGARNLPPIDFRPSDLRAADVDGDGLLDLLALNATSYASSFLEGALFRGRGDGEFADPVALELDKVGVSEVALYDMNRDGRLDLVFVARPQPDPSEVRVSFGAGDGTFAPGQRWGSFRSPLPLENPLVPGDFDRDGRVELVFANYQNDLLWVRGDESNSPRVVRRGIAAYASADLDRDGHPELLAAGNASGDRTLLHIGRSRSDGSFGFTTHAIATAGVSEIQTADVDGDGELDIILVDDLGAAIVRRVP